MAELHEIFSTAILSSEVDSQVADKVEELFLQRVENLPLNNVQYSDYFYDEKRILDVKVDLPELYEEIVNAKNTFSSLTGICTSSNQFEFWTQDYRLARQGHGRHNHGIGISGVYWIRADENASPLVFHTPNPAIKLIPKEKRTNFSDDTANAFPSKGKMVLFPSWLDHEVPPSTHDGVRSCISFNFPLLTQR